MPRKPKRYKARQHTTVISEQSKGDAEFIHTRQWRRLRAAHLRAYPLCHECEKKGLLVPGHHVDHIIALAKGGTSDSDNLMSLYHSCHSVKTYECDGAFGRTPTP